MTEKPEPPSYMRTNIELAQENGQLKQAIGQFRSDCALQSEKIVELKSQVTELSSIKEKYEQIVRIVLDMAPSGSSSLSSVVGNSSVSSAISENLRASQEVETNLNATRDIVRTVNSGRITEKSVEDSLDPPEVTSVSPLRPEKSHVPTPSLWRVLDDTPGTLENRNEHEIRQGSTFDKGPVQDSDDERDVSQDVNTHSNILPQNGGTNSASPIHPVGGHRILAQNSVFHSTPVFIPRGQQQKDLENQENLVHHNKHISTIQTSEEAHPTIDDTHTEPQSQQQSPHRDESQKDQPQSPPKSPEKPKKKGRKRQAPKKLCAEAEVNPRYNLRKRSKQ